MFGKAKVSGKLRQERLQKWNESSWKMTVFALFSITAFLVSFGEKWFSETRCGMQAGACMANSVSRPSNCLPVHARLTHLTCLPYRAPQVLLAGLHPLPALQPAGVQGRALLLRHGDRVLHAGRAAGAVAVVAAGGSHRPCGVPRWVTAVCVWQNKGSQACAAKRPWPWPSSSALECTVLWVMAVRAVPVGRQCALGCNLSSSYPSNQHAAPTPIPPHSPSAGDPLPAVPRGEAVGRHCERGRVSTQQTG